MPECELCGSKSANKKTKLEGAILNVCDECVGYGQEVKVPVMNLERKPLPKIDTDVTVKSNFKDLVRNAREKRGLKQEELAAKLNEKLSILKRVEEGWVPSPNLISKLEKFFNMELQEKIEESVTSKKKGKEVLTIGDVVEIC
jgi:putative transcription factor